MVEKTCGECGVVFRVSRKRAEKGRGVFCSRVCSGRAKARNYAKTQMYDKVQSYDEGQNYGKTQGYVQSREGGAVVNPMVGGKESTGAGGRFPSERLDKASSAARRANKNPLQRSFALEHCPWQQKNGGNGGDEGYVQPVYL